MKVLITGPLGHIGSSLMEKFKGVADELILVDSLITQRYPSCFNLNVKHQFYPLDIFIFLMATTYPLSATYPLADSIFRRLDGLN